MPFALALPCPGHPDPIEQEGTYQLPEARMDRFMLKDVLDYPSPAEEAEIIRRIDAGVYTQEQAPPDAASLDAVTEVQKLVRRVCRDPAVINYIVGLVFVTRKAGQYIDAAAEPAAAVGGQPGRASANATAAANGRNTWRTPGMLPAPSAPGTMPAHEQNSVKNQKKA